MNNGDNFSGAIRIDRILNYCVIVVYKNLTLAVTCTTN